MLQIGTTTTRRIVTTISVFVVPRLVSRSFLFYGRGKRAKKSKPVPAQALWAKTMRIQNGVDCERFWILAFELFLVLARTLRLDLPKEKFNAKNAKENAENTKRNRKSV